MPRDLHLGYSAHLRSPLRVEVALCDPERMEWRIRKAIHEARRYGGTFSLIAFQVDDAATAHTSHCSLVAALSFLEQVVRKNIRRSDQLGRWGGAEYLALSPNLALSEATGFAIRLRHLLEEEVRVDGNLRLTASFGVCQYQQGDTVEKLVNAARSTMQSARELGGNRVRVAHRESGG